MANVLLYYLIVINIVTFVVYGIDKLKAKQGSWCISEATLLIFAVIGGSIGALLGMKRGQSQTHLSHAEREHTRPRSTFGRLLPTGRKKVKYTKK